MKKVDKELQAYGMPSRMYHREKNLQFKYGWPKNWFDSLTFSSFEWNVRKMNGVLCFLYR